MQLFDSFERHIMTPKTESGGSFAFLNASAQPAFANVREVLESWFANYPSGQESDLRARFRSADEFNHCASFFELFLHELLLRMNCEVTVHPEVPSSSSRPDFRVRTQDGREYYLEAAVVMEHSRKIAAAHARYNRVLDALNDVQSPNFLVAVDLVNLPKINIPVREIKQQVSNWLSSLDYDSVVEESRPLTRKTVHRLVYEHQGWRLELHALPKGPKLRGKKGVRTVGLHGASAHWVDVSGRIKTTLARKAHAYGAISAPYVIAINVMDPVLDREDLVAALFGSERIPVLLRDGEPEVGESYRGADGFWRDSSGPRKTLVSAVLVGAPILPWNIPRADLRLVHNPWADHRYDSVLCRLPQVVAEVPNLRWMDGESLGGIFGIATDWPGEAFPRN
jgi:hypothetical protein